MTCPFSGRLQPVLVDLDVHRVRLLAGVIGPDLPLPEAHPIERRCRQAVTAVGEFLRVREGAAMAFDDACLAADVVGCADVTGRIGAAHGDAVADREAGGHDRFPSARSAAARASTSAILRPSSSTVKTPFSMSRFAAEAIHFS